MLRIQNKNIVLSLVILFLSSMPMLTSAQKKACCGAHGAKKTQTLLVASSVPKAFQEQLNAVYTAYEILKDALVKDDAAGAKVAAKQTLQHLGKVNMKLLKVMQDHKVWMPAKKVLQIKLKALSKTTVIGSQRNLFHAISNEMIQLVKHFGVGQTVYLQFCPMADSNKGAYWLSNEKKVRNPYYGASMLSCGQVKATLKK